jgi:hypothetical protein
MEYESDFDMEECFTEGDDEQDLNDDDLFDDGGGLPEEFRNTTLTEQLQPSSDSSTPKIASRAKEDMSD